MAINFMSVIKKLEDLIKLPIEEDNYELVDIQYSKRGKDWTLQIFIDKEGGVNLDDCEKMSEKLAAILDKTNLIQNSYILEVSSPGIERPLKKLKDFVRFIGKKVSVRLKTPIMNCRDFQGKISSVQEDSIEIEISQDNRITIPFSEIIFAQLKPDLPF